jgi:hypothetical protein
MTILEEIVFGHNVWDSARLACLWLDWCGVDHDVALDSCGVPKLVVWDSGSLQLAVWRECVGDIDPVTADCDYVLKLERINF